MEHRATYSPEDNKLRLYPGYRLDANEYAAIKGAGFIWAPKQELFVAPAWTPSREDFLLNWCDDIGDEDTSLVDRAEQRAERFEQYSERRAQDADCARQAVANIADNIPTGQPILVGHHSERHARKDAKRIENGMRKAVKLWRQSEYWTRRASGALRHAKYKEQPGVRARRIKTLEADKRKHERNKSHAGKTIEIWTKLSDNDCTIIKRKDGTPTTFYDRAVYIAGNTSFSGSYGIYSDLTANRITPEQAQERCITESRAIVEHSVRFIEHLDNRLAYEKAMLEEQGASDLLKPKEKPKQLPLLNYRQESFKIANIYSRGEFINYPQIDMTQAEYGKIWRDYKGTRIVENSHRIRTAMVQNRLVAVFLTDAKTHTKPEPKEPPKPIERTGQQSPVLMVSRDESPKAQEFRQIEQSLKNGVQVVTAPSLFPTPEHLARRMVELADLEAGDCVLEPSAGTGNIIQAVIDAVDTEVLAYEINADLCSKLTNKFPSHKAQVRCRDFLTVNDFQGCYPRIIMNPPFDNGADIKHIKHALTFLAPMGRLVAICANGPRQREQLKPIASLWEDLPEGTFQGTNVRAALLVINN